MKRKQGCLEALAQYYYSFSRKLYGIHQFSIFTFRALIDWHARIIMKYEPINIEEKKKSKIEGKIRCQSIKHHDETMHNIPQESALEITNT